jgi:hypothetical protein
MITPELAILIVKRAMRGADQLSIEERADLHTAASEVLQGAGLNEQAALAFTAAKNLREASASQMHFASVLMPHA